MLRSISFAIALFVLLGVGFASTQARTVEGEHSVTNKLCPLMGDEVVSGVRIEHDGQFVYFCCVGCIKMFQKDPDAAIARMSDEDKAAIEKNSICPVTKKTIEDYSIRSEHEGRFVYFATPEAKATFDKQHSGSR